jgi:hypothetical protein
VTATFDNWASVQDYALTLPFSQLASASVKVGGKAFVYVGRERGSFCVRAPLDEKDMLILTDPDTFWESPHYVGWPAVLVRFGSRDRPRIERVIRRAWWDRLTKKRQEEFGPRP